MSIADHLTKHEGCDCTPIAAPRKRRMTNDSPEDDTMTAYDRATTADGLGTDPDALAVETLRDMFESPLCPGAYQDEPCLHLAHGIEGDIAGFVTRLIALLGDAGFIIARREQLAPPAALVDTATGEALTPAKWIPRPVDPALMSNHDIVEHFASLEDQYQAMKDAWWRVMRPCKDEISRRLIDYKSPSARKNKETT